MNDLFLTIKVIPNAPKTEVVGQMDNGVIKIKICAPPEKGKANQELIQFLAAFFHVTKGAVRITSGTTSRLKKVRITGTSQDASRLLKG